MTVVLGKFLAVAEFEGDVLDALDRVEAIRNRAAIGGGAFADGIERAYQALVQARYEVDAWKVGGDELQRRADEIYAAYVAEDHNKGRS
jgi:hypothetical protein